LTLVTQSFFSWLQIIVVWFSLGYAIIFSLVTPSFSPWFSFGLRGHFVLGYAIIFRIIVLGYAIIFSLITLSFSPWLRYHFFNSHDITPNI